MITLTVLSENTARGEGLLGEHGLAFWIDTGEHRVLFDTGQGFVIEHNAERLGIDLGTCDAIALSHGHYDHVGGLEAVLRRAPRAMLHLHPRAVEPKYSGTGGRSRRISHGFFEAERFRESSRTIAVRADPHEIVPGVWSTGEIPRGNDFEDAGGPFFLDPLLSRPDPIQDEQSLYVSTRDGVVVLCGCAHAGVINTLQQVRRLTGGRPVAFVVGGWHLENASPRRMTCTVEALRQVPPEKLGFCHCTGGAASRLLWNQFPDRCVPVHVGARWTFEP